MSGLINKVKNAVSGGGDKHNTEGNTGQSFPSILDVFSTIHTDTSNSDYDRTGASTGLPGSGGYGSGTSGPHSSNTENKLDPRVDSGKFHDLNLKG